MNMTTYLGISKQNRKSFNCETKLIEHIMRAYLTEAERSRLTIVTPYSTPWQARLLAARFKIEDLLGWSGPRIYTTAENISPQWNMAPYQIGFHPDVDSRNYFRWPNWMVHLNWKELPSQPRHKRFGARIDIDQLMRPIDETWIDSERIGKALLLTAHLKEPRRKLYRVVDEVIGCDGFGRAFGKDTRRIGGKLDLSKKYSYSLCPENGIGPGYITEKIPEAFHAGCIPITWCRPEDLALDFNPKAVVNLYGLSDRQQVGTLTRLRDDPAFADTLRAEPLLLKRPSLDPLVKFLKYVTRV